MARNQHRVDASWLPEGVKTEGDDGVIATFYPDGQLKTLECMRWGAPVGIKLELAQDEQSGTASLGLESANIYRNGTSEQFDAWSDNLRPVPEDWESWVRKHIRDICKGISKPIEHPRALKAVRELEPEALKEVLRRSSPREVISSSYGYWTVLNLAAARGDPEVCRLVLAAWVASGGKLDGPEVRSGIGLAIDRDKPAFLEELPRRGYELAMRPPTECANIMADAVVHSARRCVAVLLRMGLSPNLLLESGKTPLYAAKDVEVARLLLDAGAQVNVLHWAGITPLLFHMRWQDGSEGIVKGDFPDWVSPRAAVIDLLLERGADPELTGNAFWGTCLHQAAEAPGPSNLERILPHCRDLLAKGSKGTAIDVALSWRRMLNVRRLEQEMRARGLPVEPMPEPPPEAAPVEPPRKAEAPESASGGFLAALRRLFHPGSRS